MAIVIIDNYDSFTYNITQLVSTIYSDSVETIPNDKITFTELKNKEPKGIILSPGPGHPKNNSDFGICFEIIDRIKELSCPILGICLGHQGIAYQFGASIETANEILHGKTSTLNTTYSSSLFSGLPRTFEAMRYHSLVVSKNNLPSTLRITAIDETSKEIMALEHIDYPLYGLQFHPESIGTKSGEQIMRNFSKLCA